MSIERSEFNAVGLTTALTVAAKATTPRVLVNILRPFNKRYGLHHAFHVFCLIYEACLAKHTN